MPAPQTRATRIMLLVGIVVLAFNLRPAAVSVGPVLHDISSALDMTPTSAGVLTSLPVLAFAVFGALAPRIARTLGAHRTSFVALLAVVVGLALRSLTNSVPVFLLLSVVALGGMATANVLLPSLIKLHFPDRIGLLTSIYTTALAVGLTLALMLTVPLSDRVRVVALGTSGLGGDRRYRGAAVAGPAQPRPGAGRDTSHRDAR